MRSVPHRVVCLLGLDDGVFPRQSTRDGDDVLARDPWVGERDPRSEDRQLFLDAISAAEDHLVITYTGADERTNLPVPPAVPLGELLDALDRTASVPDGAGARRRHHAPRAAALRRRATSSASRGARPFSFDPLSYAAAVAAAGPRVVPPPLFDGVAATCGRRPTSTSPTCAGCSPTRRAASCGSGWGWPRRAARTSRPTRCRSSWTTSSSGRSASGCCTSGCTASTSPTASSSSGAADALPPGPLGEVTLRALGPKVEGLLEASTLERELPPESHDVDVALARRHPAGRHRRRGPRRRPCSR